VWNPLARRSAEPERSEQPAISFNDWLELMQSFSYQGVNYTLPGATQEQIGANFTGLTKQAYKSNGVIFACMLVRMLVFSEARFQFRQLRNGRPGDLFGKFVPGRRGGAFRADPGPGGAVPRHVVADADRREVMADKATTDHKLAFFENGATPNLV
jgi:hypothetical protein